MEQFDEAGSDDDSSTGGFIDLQALICMHVVLVLQHASSETEKIGLLFKFVFFDVQTE